MFKFSGTDLLKIIALVAFMILFISMETWIFTHTGGGVVGILISFVIFIWRLFVIRQEEPYIGKTTIGKINSSHRANVNFHFSECCHRIDSDITGASIYERITFVPILSHEISSDYDIRCLYDCLIKSKAEGFTEVRDFYQARVYNSYTIEEAVKLFVPVEYHCPAAKLYFP